MAGVDDIIGGWVKQAEKSGELRRGRYWGKPIRFDDGFAETPAELRMTHKILKNAGFVPAEVEMMQELERLRRCLDETEADADRQALRREIAELRQRLSVRLEKYQR